MTQFTKEIKIDASIDELWRILSDLGAVYQYSPGVSDSYYVSTKREEVGASRICELLPMGKVQETATEWHHKKGYTLRVYPLEKMPPVDKVYVSINLDQSSLKYVKVTVMFQYEMKLGVIGKMLNKLIVRSQMEKGIQGVLDGLKVYAEKGIEVTNLHMLEKLMEVA